MKITEAQYSRIEQYLPRPRGKFSVSNLNVLNAIIYVLENGSKWHCLPEHFGNWHTIYSAGTEKRFLPLVEHREILTSNGGNIYQFTAVRLRGYHF